MHNVITSRHIRSSSELYLMVPIKTGFVPISELVLSYASRITAVLKALSELRQQKVERGHLDPYGPIELLNTIYRVQWSVLEPFDQRLHFAPTVQSQLRTPQLILTSHFDSSWENYFSNLLDIGGPLLDLVFSHCEGYETNSCEDGYERFSAFIRRHQRPVDFLFANAPEVSIDDIRYFKQLLLRDATQQGTAPRLPLQTVLDEAKALKNSAKGTPLNEHTRSAASGVLALAEVGRLLFSNQVELKTRTGDRTGRQLYEEAIASVLEYEPDVDRLVAALSDADPSQPFETLRVLKHKVDRDNAAREARKQTLVDANSALPTLEDLKKLAPGNIVEEYEEIKGGVFIMLRCDQPEQLADLLVRLRDGAKASARGLYLSFGVTYAGLVRSGLSDDVLAQFPREFQEGMEERAGLFGDVGPFNHPRFWRPPLKPGTESERIYLGTVDVVVVVHSKTSDGGLAARAHFDAVVKELDGLEVLYELPLVRRDHDHFGFADHVSQPIPAHKDGKTPVEDRNVTALGEFLLGYGDARGRVADCANAERNKSSHALFKDSTFLVVRKMVQDAGALNDYIADPHGTLPHHNGNSSLPAKIAEVLGVVGEISRKVVEPLLRVFETHAEKVDPTTLGHDVRSLLALLIQLGMPSTWLRGTNREVGARVQKALSRASAGAPSAPPPDDLKALLVGRRQDGLLRSPLTPDPKSNHFDFSGDQGGAVCPFRSHIRLSNPRVEGTPRILRRGMAFGPEAREGGESGSLFMAYNASIAAQYELLQRYLNGGNPTGLSSYHNDILSGANNAAGMLRFVSTDPPGGGSGGVGPLSLPDRPADRPFVTLRWGLYVFVPSPRAVDALHELIVKGDHNDELAKQAASSIERGQRRILELQAMPDDIASAEWKRLLEEAPEAGSEQARQADDVWAAIRADKGYLQIPAGPGKNAGATLPSCRVLVGTERAALKVLGDDGPTFSVSEYKNRFKKTIKDHYIAHDVLPTLPAPAPSYAQLSTAPNTYVYELGTPANGYTISRAHDEAKAICQQVLSAPGSFELELTSKVPNGTTPRSALSVRDLAQIVVAKLCVAWFGLPIIVPPANGAPALPPGRDLTEALENFLITSRYIFQTNPEQFLGTDARGRRGNILNHRPAGSTSFAQDVSSDYQAQGLKNVQDLTDRASIGAVVGFAPPAVGAIVRVLDQWIETEELWNYQARGGSESVVRGHILAALGRTPSPTILYRTAVQEVNLQEVSAPKNAQVVVGLRSVYVDAVATPKGARPQPEMPPEAWLFGGDNRGTSNVAQNPPHGCPARAAGTDVLLGIVMAIFERKNIKRDRRMVISYDR